MNKVSSLLFAIDYDGTLNDPKNGRTTPETMAQYIRDIGSSFWGIASDVRMCIVSTNVPPESEYLRANAPLAAILQLQGTALVASQPQDLKELESWIGQTGVCPSRAFILDDSPTSGTSKLRVISTNLGKLGISAELFSLAKNNVIAYPDYREPAQIAAFIAQKLAPTA